jgi:hypothetical protein
LESIPLGGIYKKKSNRDPPTTFQKNPIDSNVSIEMYTELMHRFEFQFDEALDLKVDQCERERRELRSAETNEVA